MKAHSVIASMMMGLFLSFAVPAEPLAVHFRPSGDGTIVKEASRRGIIELKTNGKGKPNILSAPLKFDDFRRENLYFEIKIDKIKNLSGFEIWLGDKEFKNYYALTLPIFKDPKFNIVQGDYWQTYSFSLSNATEVGHPQRGFEQMGLYIQDNGGGPIDVAFRNLRFARAPATGYVSLTFDDGYVDHYRAAKIMQKYNFPGTAYIMPRQIGQPSYMTLEQVKELKAKYHWGISAHHEIPYTDFKPKELQSEIKYTLHYLTENGFSASAQHLAYPLGKQDRKVVLPLVKRYFETARVAGGGVETLPPADPHLLRTINVTSETSPKELVSKVTEAVDNGQWAILMFHYLVDEPKALTEYRESDFVEFIDLLGKAKVPVLSVDEVYRILHPTMTADSK